MVAEILATEAGCQLMVVDVGALFERNAGLVAD